MNTYEIIMTILAVLFGALSIYMKSNQKIVETKNELQEKVNGYIDDAEELYSDVTKAGGVKREWVIDKLYNLVPAGLKPFFSHDLMEQIVQGAFDAIQSFAKKQLDKVVDKVIPDNPEDSKE